jgi:hypothetical protein
MVGSAVADDEADDCAEDCDSLLCDGAADCADDCALANAEGRNAASSTAPRRAPVWQHALANVFRIETRKSRSFDRQNLIMLSVQQ